jgi:hypothetical protein
MARALIRVTIRTGENLDETFTLRARSDDGLSLPFRVEEACYERTVGRRTVRNTADGLAGKTVPEVLEYLGRRFV